MLYFIVEKVWLCIHDIFKHTRVCYRQGNHFDQTETEEQKYEWEEIKSNLFDAVFYSSFGTAFWHFLLEWGRCGKKGGVK